MAQESAEQRLFRETLTLPKNYRKHRARENKPLFSVFNDEQQRVSLELADKYSEMATKGVPFTKIIEVAREDTQNEAYDLELVQYALIVFVTHHESTKGRIAIPPLIQRYPRSLLRHRFSKFAIHEEHLEFRHAVEHAGETISGIFQQVGERAQQAFTSITGGDDQHRTRAVEEEPGPSRGHHTVNDLINRHRQQAAPKRPAPATGVDKIANRQVLLAWWLEDPMLNEHHEHWHFVFPSQRRPGKDRQGELFIYMHKQMLARYDAERLALGYEPVKAFSNYEEPLDPYTPYKALKTTSSSGQQGIFGARPAGTRMPESQTNQLRVWRQRIEQAIEAGAFSNNTAVTPNLMGAVLEPSNAQNHPGNQYGSLHNTGHGIIAGLSVLAGGVMATTRTACRDPIFWRWHKHVDELFNDWVDRQKPPHDFSSDAPPVVVNGTILCSRDHLEKAAPGGASEDFKSYGEQHFGGDKFDQAISIVSHPDTTDELQTEIRTRTFDWPEDSGESETISYVYPREWYYFIRLTNTSNQTVPVTIRVFLCPTVHADSRAHWIEMDKFIYTLQPNAKVVVSQPCDAASVIRKEAAKTAEQMDRIFGWVKSAESRYCDCGWPFNLLLPRGASDTGTPYKLVVMVTDHNIDRVEKTDRKCGSLSFCGSQAGSMYPDKRDMGYPFDAPFKSANGKPSFHETFKDIKNLNVRDVTLTLAA